LPVLNPGRVASKTVGRSCREVIKERTGKGEEKKRDNLMERRGIEKKKKWEEE